LGRTIRKHLLTSLLLGVGLGLAARMIMRVVAWSAGLAGSFSTGGSFEVVLFGAMIGTPVAFGLLVIRERMTRRTRWLGRAVGGILFALFVLLPPESARSAMAATPDPPLLTVLLFGGLLFLFGWSLDLLPSAKSREHSPDRR
jgi:hypothetical protein